VETALAQTAENEKIAAMETNEDMTPSKWEKVCGQVTEAMRLHTRPFVAPLSISDDQNVRLVGTGSFVSLPNRRILLTCEHVSSVGLMGYQLFGTETVHLHRGAFVCQPFPIDASFTEIDDSLWSQESHQATTVPYERFASKHSLIDKSEILFFRGFAGENSHYGFGVLETNGTAYCSQQKVVENDNPCHFEIFWEPSKTQFISSTSEAERVHVPCDDPGGLSGSLVWNTRYIEASKNGRQWSPDMAVVTGLLQRWDSRTKTVLALRVEHLKRWMDDHSKT
jgi:hypothetical protein